MNLFHPDWSVLNLQVLGPPLAAGLLVTATHVPLGREVLKRGIIFIDLAVAQIAGLGVIAASNLGWNSGWAVQVAAALSALAGALLLHAMERRWPQVQEALIGSTFVLAATGGLLLLAGNPHGAEHLQDLLTGQLLWVRLDQLAPVILVYAMVLALWFGLRRRGRLAFYLMFGLAVTASVQLVGVYLVFATLIIPALTVRRQGPVGGLAAGYAVGAGAYLAGLTVSALTDLPAGPAVVWALALLGVVVSRWNATAWPNRGSMHQ
ncbi:MAG: metal ABC transporter permease [Gammaproteobacteria bacterium]